MAARLAQLRTKAAQAADFASKPSLPIYLTNAAPRRRRASLLFLEPPSPPPAGAEQVRFESNLIQSSRDGTWWSVVLPRAHGRAAEMHKSKLSGVLHKGFKPDKCKIALKMAMARIKLLRNKKEAQVRQMRREVAQLLEGNQDQTARIRSNASSGMGVAPDIRETFLELQMKKAFRYVIFKIEEKQKQVVVEKTGATIESYDDFLASLPENDCRYALYDFDFVTGENV